MRKKLVINKEEATVIAERIKNDLLLLLTVEHETEDKSYLTRSQQHLVPNESGSEGIYLGRDEVKKLALYFIEFLSKQAAKDPEYWTETKALISRLIHKPVKKKGWFKTDYFDIELGAFGRNKQPKIKKR